MEMSVQFHAPATLLQAKNTDTHWVGGFMGPRIGLHGYIEQKISFLCRDQKVESSSP